MNRIFTKEVNFLLPALQDYKDKEYHNRMMTYFDEVDGVAQVSSEKNLEDISSNGLKEGL